MILNSISESCLFAVRIERKKKNVLFYANGTRDFEFYLDSFL